jgi:tetratricopeptide (TPR) repeat protein
MQLLLEQAEQFEQGAAPRIDILLQAVDLADSLGDINLGYETRDELIESAAFGGRSELIFPAFAWILGQLDKGNIAQYSTWSILWKYKWAVNHLNGFPNISKQQIEAAIEDFAKRLENIGENPRVLHFLRWKYQVHRGDLTLATREMRLWQQQSRSYMSDCEACETNFHAQYLASLGQHQAALEMAEPIFDGRLRCGEIPQITYAYMLRSLLHEKKYTEAMQFHRKGYKSIKDNFEFLNHIGLHLEFLVFTKNLPSAIKLFEKHLTWALDQKDLSLCFDFYVSLVPLWKALLENHQSVIKMQLPKNFAVKPQEKGYNTLELQAHFQRELEQIATLFDSRNGTTAFADRMTDFPDWPKNVPHIPLRQKSEAV